MRRYNKVPEDGSDAGYLRMEINVGMGKFFTLQFGFIKFDGAGGKQLSIGFTIEPCTIRWGGAS